MYKCAADVPFLSWPLAIDVLHGEPHGHQARHSRKAEWSKDWDCQQFPASIVISEVEKKGLGASEKKDFRRRGRAVGARHNPGVSS